MCVFVFLYKLMIGTSAHGTSGSSTNVSFEGLEAKTGGNVNTVLLCGTLNTKKKLYNKQEPPPMHVCQLCLPDTVACDEISVFAYWKQPKTGGGEGVGTRLVLLGMFTQVLKNACAVYYVCLQMLSVYNLLPGKYTGWLLLIIKRNSSKHTQWDPSCEHLWKAAIQDTSFGPECTYICLCTIKILKCTTLQQAFCSSCYCCN